MQRRNSYLIGKAFKSYIVASVLTVASTQVANIVDAAIVGNLIGPEALASVNLCKPVLQAFFSFSCLYVSSATMMAGMAIGQGDKRKADKLFSFAIVTSILLGLVLMILGLVAFSPLSRLLCNSIGHCGSSSSGACSSLLPFFSTPVFSLQFVLYPPY